jgi:hypothetical protein
MKPFKANIRAAIEDYFRDSPDGLDVTAHVLDAIGPDDMESDARNTHRTIDQAKQDLGRLISSEILPEMFFGVEPLNLVKVDAKRWPNLVGWVASYTQHRVGRRRH